MTITDDIIVSLPDHGKTEFEFDRDGWPIDPATGKAFRPGEIINDLTGEIPYPLHVDPANPGSYWKRREKPAPKAKRRRRGRSRSQRATAGLISFRFEKSSATRQATGRAGATAELVSRVNNEEDPGEVAK